jgi:dienelactone hydrolase
MDHPTKKSILMTRQFLKVVSRLTAVVAIGVASMTSHANDDVIPVEKFQPAITVQFAPEKPNGWELERPMAAYGMNLFAANVPAYNGKGKLISSWSPQQGRVFEQPTVIIVHGGHGISPANVDMAVWLRKELKANVLILDSYWSRGKSENWLAWTEYGANMRVLDLIAAARFTQSQGADPKKTFVIGGSQGGWTVLRAFSNHNLSGEVKSLLVGGASLYPNCYVKESIFGKSPSGTTDKQFAPPLGNYVAPVIAFTGTNDSATPLSQCNVEKVFKGVEKWTNFEGATHSWDSPSGGIGRPGVDGSCSNALNKYNQFPVCRNNKYTEIMRSDILAFIERHIPKAQ